MNTVIVQERGTNLIIRAIYFILFGLWFSGVWAAIAWVFCVTIIGLPLGLWMLNRLPQVSTLQPQRADLVISNDGRVYQRSMRQTPFLLRAIYFLLVGWWFSALWMAAAWALCSVIIGMPFGFWMFNRVPAVITLGRG
ncbi:YccF domain-containing protein [Chloroflexales bacterium ZM16-3]|nr:YccF domain-containing protein [Chloroflexales bacterium ZM16-3]